MFDEKVPKFTGKKNDFPMWSAKAQPYLAMKFLEPSLLTSFKGVVHANVGQKRLNCNIYVILSIF